jgi:DNA-binding MarR family transcriptional regulator
MSTISDNSKDTAIEPTTVSSLWKSLMELNRQVKQMIQLMSIESGISYSSVCLIFKLEHVPSLKMNDIAGFLSITVGAATSLVDKLESQGWIERIRSLEDRRIINVCLTEQGIRQLTEIREQFTARGEHIFTAIPQEQLAALERELGKINSIMNHYNQI